MKMATIDHATGRVLGDLTADEALAVSLGQKRIEDVQSGIVTTDASGMQEISVVAKRITGFDWRAWLKPPKVYIVGAVAAGIIYAIATKKKRGRR
jgi:hypothetical protein